MDLIWETYSKYYSISISELKEIDNNSPYKNCNFYTVDFYKTFFIRNRIPYLDCGSHSPSIKLDWDYFDETENLIILIQEEIRND